MGLADEAAARWGREGAVFVRSSASHVFLAGATSCCGWRRSARPRPRRWPARRRPPRSCAASERRYPPPVPSRAGSPRRGGRRHGRHRPAPRAGHDVRRRRAHRRARPRLGVGRSRRFHATGYVHGDPEPDNLVVDGEVATFVDLDDAGPGQPADDLAFALPPAGSRTARWRRTTPTSPPQPTRPGPTGRASCTLVSASSPRRCDRPGSSDSQLWACSTSTQRSRPPRAWTRSTPRPPFTTSSWSVARTTSSPPPMLACSEVLP